MKKIGIIGAMESEVNVLSAAINAKQIESGGLKFFEGEIGGNNVVVVKSGIGKVNAALCAQRLILEFGVTHIINTGIAGAMGKNLNIFDIVVSTDAVYHDMDATGFGYNPTQIPQMAVSAFEADAAMIKNAEDAFEKSDFSKKHKIVKGRVASGDQFISSVEVKKHIEEVCAPACVEMEGAAIAHACWLNKTPFVIIRCMSDNASEGDNKTCDFNEQTCADECAAIVLNMIPNC